MATAQILGEFSPSRFPQMLRTETQLDHEVKLIGACLNHAFQGSNTAFPAFQALRILLYLHPHLDSSIAYTPAHSSELHCTSIPTTTQRLEKLDDDPKMSPKTAAKPAKLPVTVDKPTPYHFDLGLLLANDPNPLSISSDTREADLAAVARDGTQVLINQLLTTCPISATKEGVLLTLPPAQTALPREKPIPAPKAETKWSAFAKRRGIKSKTREQRRNLAYDEATGEFGRKWGYKGANKAGQDEPIIEVPFNSRKELERKEGTSIRGDRRREIREKIKKNEKQMRKNQGRNAEGGR